MSAIDKGIELIGSVLNSATVYLWGIETINGFNNVLMKLRKIKYDIMFRTHFAKTKDQSEDEME